MLRNLGAVKMDLYHIKDGILKKQKGLFIDRVSMKITICIAVAAGLLSILDGFKSIYSPVRMDLNQYLDKIMEVLGYVSN